MDFGNKFDEACVHTYPVVFVSQIFVTIRCCGHGFGSEGSKKKLPKKQRKNSSKKFEQTRSKIPWTLSLCSG